MIKFSFKFLTPSKVSELRESITRFAQEENEEIHKAWERYKGTLRRCPNHGLPDWLEIDLFYKGLKPSIRTIVDLSAGGALNRLSHDEAYDLLDVLASNDSQWISR